MNRFKLILLLAASIMLYPSCDEVEFPNEDDGGGTVINNDDTRRVLVMDFTGHRCAGCPAAAREAGEMADDFEGQIFVMAVHPDIPSLTDPVAGAEPGDEFYTEWRTDEGSHYQDIFNIPSAIPLGVVSAVDISGNYFAPWASWRSVAEPLIMEDRVVTVDFASEYNETSREIQIMSNVEFHQPVDGSYNMILAVVENDIVDWQKNGTSDSPADPAFGGGNIPDYVHKHVLRKHINGLQGSEVTTTGADAGATFEFMHDGDIDPDFVAEEVSIYAYIYDVSTLEILDVVEHHIIE